MGLGARPPPHPSKKARKALFDSAGTGGGCSGEGGGGVGGGGLASSAASGHLASLLCFRCGLFPPHTVPQTRVQVDARAAATLADAVAVASSSRAPSFHDSESAFESALVGAFAPLPPPMAAAAARVSMSPTAWHLVGEAAARGTRQPSAPLSGCLRCAAVTLASGVWAGLPPSVTSAACGVPATAVGGAAGGGAVGAAAVGSAGRIVDYSSSWFTQAAVTAAAAELSSSGALVVHSFRRLERALGAQYSLSVSATVHNEGWAAVAAAATAGLGAEAMEEVLDESHPPHSSWRASGSSMQSRSPKAPPSRVCPFGAGVLGGMGSCLPTAADVCAAVQGAGVVVDESAMWVSPGHEVHQKDGGHGGHGAMKDAKDGGQPGTSGPRAVGAEDVSRSRLCAVGRADPLVCAQRGALRRIMGREPAAPRAMKPRAPVVTGGSAPCAALSEMICDSLSASVFGVLRVYDPSL